MLCNSFAVLVIVVVDDRLIVRAMYKLDDWSSAELFGTLHLRLLVLTPAECLPCLTVSCLAKVLLTRNLF